MTAQLRFKREGAETIKVGIIPDTDNNELRHLTKMGTILKQKIPFRYDVVLEPSVVIASNKPQVVLTVRPTAINVVAAMGELKAKSFIPGFETAQA